METITLTEIAKLMGISRECLQQRYRKTSFALPPPVGKDRNFLLYDRKAVLVFIERYLEENGKPEAVSPGLDNALARQFLTRRAYSPKV